MNLGLGAVYRQAFTCGTKELATAFPADGQYEPAILGQFMGVNAVLYYGPKIFSDAGLSGESSMFSTVLVGIVNMLTTVIALLIIDKVGRKQLVWWGVGGMILCLLMIGLYFCFPQSLPTWFLLTFFLLYVFC